MVGQYLPQTNEMCYSVLQLFFHVATVLSRGHSLAFPYVCPCSVGAVQLCYSAKHRDARLHGRYRFGPPKRNRISLPRGEAARISTPTPCEHIRASATERDPLPFRRHRQRDVRLPWDVDWTSDGKKQHYTNRVDPLAQEHDAAQSGRKSGRDKGREADGKGRELTRTGARRSAWRRLPEGRTAAVALQSCM